MDGFVNIIRESYRHFPDYSIARSEFSDDAKRSSAYINVATDQATFLASASAFRRQRWPDIAMAVARRYG